MFGNILAILLGATSLVSIALIGQLRLMEVLIVGLGPLLVLRGLRKMSHPALVVFLCGGLAWFVAQALSDWYNNSSAHNYLRGLASIAMVLLSTVTFHALFYEHTNRYRWFLVGCIPASIYFVLTGGIMRDASLVSERLMGEEWWDTSVAPIATPILLVSGSLVARRLPKVLTVMYVVYGLAAIVEQSRAHGLAFCTIGTLFYISRYPSRFRLDLRRTALVTAPILAMVFFGYVHFGLQGSLGKKTQRQLLALEQPYNPIYVIFIGRSHVLVALEAIEDRPLIGHGSWAQNPKYTKALARIESQLGVSRDSELVGELDVIPTHSVILGNWVYCGLVGGVFWMWVAWLSISLFRKALTHPEPTEALMVLHFGVTTLLLLPFSPTGGVRGIWTASFAFALATTAVRRNTGAIAHIGCSTPSPSSTSAD